MKKKNLLMFAIALSLSATNLLAQKMYVSANVGYGFALGSQTNPDFQNTTSTSTSTTLQNK